MNQHDNLKRHFFLAAIFISLLLTLIGQGILLPFLFYFKPRISDAGIKFLLLYASFLGTWVVTILYCRFAEKDIYKSIFSAKRGGGKGNTVKNLLIGLLLGFAMNGLCAFVAFLNKDLAFSFSSFDILYLAMGLIAVFIQSGAEELVMRGYLYGAVNARHGVMAAFIVNSLVFALLHGANTGVSITGILLLILISILTSLFVWRYGSLWMAMGLHTGWNYTQSLLLGLPNSGLVSKKSLLHLDAASDSIFYSAAFGLEGGITIIVILCVIIAFILFLKPSENVTNKENNDHE